LTPVAADDGPAAAACCWHRQRLLTSTVCVTSCREMALGFTPGHTVSPVSLPVTARVMSSVSLPRQAGPDLLVILIATSGTSCSGPSALLAAAAAVMGVGGGGRGGGGAGGGGGGGLTGVSCRLPKVEVTLAPLLAGCPASSASHSPGSAVHTPAAKRSCRDLAAPSGAWKVRRHLQVQLPDCVGRDGEEWARQEDRREGKDAA
jgi:hypothetical protein